MSLPNYLAKIKSSGVYRYVFDLSEIPQEERSTLRLVVGYSEKGPFNTPVFVEDASEFIQLFGNTSRRMERKGIFFHRMAIQALAAGPILALNIKPFNKSAAEMEKTTMISFNASDLCLKEVIVDPALQVAAKEEEIAKIEKDITAAYTEYKNAEGDEKATKKQAWENLKQERAKLKDELAKLKEDKVTILQQNSENIKKEVPIVANINDYNRTVVNSIYDTNRFWKINDDIMSIADANVDVAGHGKEDYIRIVQTGSKENSVTLFMRPYVPQSGWDVKISDWYTSEDSEDMPGYFESIKDHLLSEFFVEIYAFRGNLAKEGLFDETGTLGSYKFDEKGDKVWQELCKVENGAVYTNPDYTDAFGNKTDSLVTLSDVSTSNFINRYQGILFPHFKSGTGSYISIDSVFNRDTDLHGCVLALNEKLLDDAYEADLNSNDVYDNGEEAPEIGGVSTGDKRIDSFVHRLTSCICSVAEDGTSTTYDPAVLAATNNLTISKVKGFYMEGYEYKCIAKNETGEALQKKIFEVLNYKGIFEALTNNVDSDWKYIIDTFQAYPSPSLRANFAAICKKKFNCLGLVNFPPIVDCATACGYPGMKGGFDMKKLIETGSPISLPSDSQGASFIAFYTQLQFTDGSNKFLIPSAALVSNLFIDKLNNRQKYDIVAGPNYGRIDYNGLVGPDYSYARNDLDILEPMGVNAIVYIPRRGILVNSNQTAKQTPVTALSKVNVRELVTFLQDELEEMLYGYQWQLNTSTLREKVETKARQILELCKANGGIYAYAAKCDDTNNTPEVIDNEMVILEVDIEAARGAGKMVQVLRLHRTGGLTQVNG